MPSRHALLPLLIAALCAGAPINLPFAAAQAPEPAAAESAPAEPAAAESTSAKTPPAAGGGLGSFQPVAIEPEGRKAIDKGMKFLLGAMRQDGKIGADVNYPPDLSCTAMLGLALLAEGNTPYGGPHSAELRRVLDAVLNMADALPSGARPHSRTTLVQHKIGLNADRFLAAVFLSEIIGETGEVDGEVHKTLERLVKDISDTQGADGTWGDESWAPVLGTVLGWESLRNSASCGLKVDASAELVGQALLKKLRAKNSSHEGWMHDFYKNASAIRVLYSMGHRDDPLYKQSLERTIFAAQKDERPFKEAGGEEFLAFFLVSECLLQSPDGEGVTWYPLVSKGLIKTQNPDGSWTGHHCITNRTFCTAAALLTLQAPNYCLSISNL
ncbi:hypothetical protein [Lacipirellula parvula]|uniref:Squalene cyclase C-terminal domain-containing protein n=1 Tax=Lacipirellula parvula TaxID=2650471 RepID=A0A5K7XAZ1_9BACT|nr:hypothetical protein [Lacipirellula parvula]BBO33900.1 hypothetical protein PLANPX_3512 [Lacipirellula parvula]